MAISKPTSLVGDPMPPPPPRPPKRKKIVLDEDEYVEHLGRIIERDFFPDIPVLRSQLRGWERLDAQAGGAAVVAETPATPEEGGLTPGIATDYRSLQGSFRPSVGDRTVVVSKGRRVSVGTPCVRGIEGDVFSSGAEPREERDAQAGHNQSLDEFVSTYTSEDNASFEELQQEGLKRKKLKFGHYLEDKNKPLKLQASTATDGYGTTGQSPDTVVLWKHVAKNSLYYDPSETGLAPYTSKELAERVQGPPKEVKHENTRFPGTNCPAQVEDCTARGAGLATQEVKEKEKSYSFLATPSPAPGVQESPLMTWGELGSTPVRLAGDATPFRIQALPQRDKVGQVLAREARKSLKQRKSTKASTSLDRSVCTPKELSAAGRRLASVLKSKTPVSDMQLRASYLGSQPGIWKAGTPLRNPKDRAAAKDRHSEAEGRKESITDDLLDI